ncbi:thiamine phosphate synthase [Hazenella sp. IB182357]|uniref:Thiamine phosphate synthase n=1 Tax=Polycladospora coralii TaxID=2771432 RepID=A0A926RU31_9BACL|nr:thiamine phosphate synthase [Polycladospora coralii]MBD1372077.1 thiamine phosphate synthase [Polycladospora coralii]
MKKIPQLHAITTGEQDIIDLIAIIEVIHPYVDAIHLREKERNASDLQEILLTLRQKGVPLQKMIVNDRADVASAFQVRGVQLAYHSLDVCYVKPCFPNLLIGKSVHSVAEGKQAEGDGADYVLFGHIFSSSSKPGKKAQGLCQLERLVAEVRVPVIAIGGISPKRACEVMRIGSAGIAVMSGIFKHPYPQQAAQMYKKILVNGDENGARKL